MVSPVAGVAMVSSVGGVAMVWPVAGVAIETPVAGVAIESPRRLASRRLVPPPQLESWNSAKNNNPSARQRSGSSAETQEGEKRKTLVTNLPDQSHDYD